MQRELRRGAQGPAQQLLHDHAHETAYLSATALGEFAEGFAVRTHPVLRSVLAAFVVLPIDEETALHYAQIVRPLRATGQLIGANDLWIGASARRHGLRLVTKDGAHFARIAHLKLKTYG